MKTRLLQMNENSIKEASEIIANGGLVAFPTETVYGLGVSAYSGSSVNDVFAVKGRPSDNPLIVHVGMVEDAVLATDNITPLARLLFKHFSPGPITVVCDKGSKIANEVTAGLDSVGIRIPEHASAREFLKACRVPVAAPSANTSTRPSPTTAQAVFDDIGGKIAMILDGGSCDVGIESTVVDARGEYPIILRSGKITKQDIEKVCGRCEIAGETSKVRSPGVKYKHYAPKCDMMAVVTTDITRVQSEVDTLTANGERVVLLGSNSLESVKNAQFIDIGSTPTDFMKHYYNALRLGENMGSVILCIVPFGEENAEGIYNRIRKSCGGKLFD